MGVIITPIWSEIVLLKLNLTLFLELNFSLTLQGEFFSIIINITCIAYNTLDYSLQTSCYSCFVLFCFVLFFLSTKGNFISIIILHYSNTYYR